MKKKFNESLFSKEYKLERQMKKSELVYKYSDWNKNTKDAIIKRYFWFSKPPFFNDPFDSNMDIFNAFKVSEEIFKKPFRGTGKTTFDFIKKNTNNFGVLCLTKATQDGEIGDKGYNNLHFWAHYANAYKGIAIGYNSNILENYYSTKFQCDAALKKVIYFDKPVDIDNHEFIIDNSTNFTQKIRGIFGLYRDDNKIDAFFEQILLFKDGRIWEKENEYRIILASKALEKLNNNLFPEVDYSKIDINCKGYRIPYPQKSIINEVTFGVNFDKKEIINAINIISKNNNGVKFFQSYLDLENADIIRKEIKNSGGKLSRLRKWFCIIKC